MSTFSPIQNYGVVADFDITGLKRLCFTLGKALDKVINGITVYQNPESSEQKRNDAYDVLVFDFIAKVIPSYKKIQQEICNEYSIITNLPYITEASLNVSPQDRKGPNLSEKYGDVVERLNALAQLQWALLSKDYQCIWDPTLYSTGNGRAGVFKTLANICGEDLFRPINPNSFFSTVPCYRYNRRTEELEDSTLAEINDNTRGFIKLKNRAAEYGVLFIDWNGQPIS